jgi:hypothetical protein
LLDVIVEALSTASVRYLLIGGQAVNLLPLQPRVTFDIDFSVLPRAGALERVRDLLERHGFEVVQQQSADPSRGLDFLRMRHAESGLGLDFETASTDFEESAISRGVILRSDLPVPCATPEDLIVFKLIANRHRDQADLIELVQLPGIDWDYVRKWTAEWELDARLNALLLLVARDSESGPP